MRLSGVVVLVLTAFIGASVVGADDGMRAVEITISDPAGNALFLEPSERVDIFLASGSGHDILLRSVRVLGPLNQKKDWSDDPLLPKRLTVEVSRGDAEQLALLQSRGTLSIFLGDDSPASRRRSSANSLGLVYIPTLSTWGRLDFPRFCIPPYAELPRFCVPTRADDPRTYMRGNFPDRV